jgi:hypothetical protein
MSVRAPDIADLGWKVSDHVCAFYNEGGNFLDDIIVDYLTKGLQAGNKCAFFCFNDTASRVRERIPEELMARGYPAIRHGRRGTPECGWLLQGWIPTQYGRAC